MRRRLAALIVPVIVVGLLGSACTGGGNRELVAEFLNVGDLVGRASVQQSDAVIGSVRSIDLVQRGEEWVARVRMRIDPDTRVSEGATAVVRSTSLLGEKFVDLVPAPTPGPQLPDGAVLPVSRTSKAPELEELFSQLGAILATGALEDLARLTSAGAMILEGQEDNLGRVLDQTATLISSLHAQKDSIASAVDDLASASRTLSARTGTLDRALSVSDDALRIVAGQQRELDELVVQLDRLGKPLGDLTRAHKGDIDAQVKAVRKVVPQLYAVRDTLGEAVDKLPDFTRLFARAAPGDYVQLDILLQAVPIELSSSPSSLASIFLAATTATTTGAKK
jgi:phospholipid/cholesterol/gamma-HCH transport system substrate-binding protein